MDKVKEACDLVDTILKGSYSQYKALKEADSILDEVENSIDNVPNQCIPSLLDDVMSDIAEDEVEKNEEEIEQANAEVQAPMESEKLTVEESMKKAVKLLVTEETYRDYFKSMLKKWKISSPSDLDGDKKKAFFNAVDKGWKAKKETD
jgi:hypothetical protein